MLRLTHIIIWCCKRVIRNLAVCSSYRCFLFACSDKFVQEKVRLNYAVLLAHTLARWRKHSESLTLVSSINNLNDFRVARAYSRRINCVSHLNMRISCITFSPRRPNISVIPSRTPRITKWPNIVRNENKRVKHVMFRLTSRELAQRYFDRVTYSKLEFTEIRCRLVRQSDFQTSHISPYQK